MTSKVRQLEERVARLEKEFDEFKATMPGRKKKPWYEEIVGDFEGDNAFEEIVRLGAQIRKADRKVAR